MSNKNYDLPGIFSAVLEIRDEKERLELVERLTQGDKSVQRQVNELLKAHQSAEHFLSHPPQDLLETGSPASPNLAKRVSAMTALKTEFSLHPVVLRDDNSDISEPVVRPGSTEIPNRNPNDRYQLQGEIARGGMGAILKGRDVDLGRSLAIKVLLDAHMENSQVVQRFVEEAQIGGQLQHPGIAPVYELGQFEDQRPYFTMKLVKGQTLAAMLFERKDVFDRGKLLGIFEQICQTMAYAHSRGVIHRDLKPANIMVGAFGEVQVMDWGLAKVLESGGTADEKKARLQHSPHSVIQTFRSDGSGPAMVGTDPANAGETMAGSVMGTPAYMPPEQARGEVDRLDERCDVFGLGAILCEILSGRPPYFDDNPREVIHLAQQGSLGAAFKDLDMCRADKELVEIAKNCLAAEPTKRIRNAKLLAERVSGYLESVEKKLHETELARAAEATRAVEARKRQQVTIALAASILLTIGLGTAAWLWNQNQFNQRRIAATGKVNAALGEARLQLALAESVPVSEKVVELEKAIASANTANELVADDAVVDSLKQTANDLLTGLQQQLQTAQERAKLAEADLKLKEKLEFIRLSHADGKKKIDTRKTAQNFDTIQTRKEYALAFREAGHDIMKRPQAETVTWVRTSEIQESLISAMDHWSRCLPTKRQFEDYLPWTKATSWEEAAGIAKQLRDANRGDTIRWMHYGGLLAMAVDDEAYQELCSEMLAEFDQNRSAFVQERICKMCLLKPGLVNADTLPSRWEMLLDRQSKPTTVTSWLPWAWNARAMKAYRKADYQNALIYIKKSESLDPTSINHALNLCIMSLTEHQLGNSKTALATLKSAQVKLRDALKISTSFHHDHILARTWIHEAEQLISPDAEPAQFLFDQIPVQSAEATGVSIQSLLNTGSLNQRLFAIADEVDSSDKRKSVRIALRDGDVESLKQLAADSGIRNQQPEMIASLARALREANELEQAASILRAGQRLHPDDFWLNYELGKCLIQLEKFEEGIGFSRAALAIRPASSGAMWGVTSALMDANRNEEALEQFKVLLARFDLSASGYEGLASSMDDYGNQKAAILAIKKALEMDPDNSIYLLRLAGILVKLDRIEDALIEVKKAIAIDPQSTLPLSQYASILWGAGREQEAIEQARIGTELFPDTGFFYHLLGAYLLGTGENQKALDALKTAVERSPEKLAYRHNLSMAYGRLGLLDEAGEERSLSIEGYAKKEKAYRKVVENDPKSGDAHYDLGYVLYQQRRYAEAAESFEESIKIDGTIPTRFYKYGFALWQLDRKDEALEQWRKALTLNPELAKYHERVGWALTELARDEDAIPFYEEAVKLNPDFAHARDMLASVLSRTGKADEAVELERQAVAKDPNNARLHMQLAMRLFRSGSLVECEQALLEGLELNPKQPELFIHFLGETQAALGKTNDAIETFETALKENDHPVLHNGLASVLYRSKGDLKRAEKEYRKALESGNPTHKRLARIGLSDLLTRTGRINEAEELFAIDGKTIRAFPLLYCQNIYVRFVKGEKKAALKAVELFVENRPNNSHGYVIWADLLVHEPDDQGNYPFAAQAVKLAEKACEIQSHSSAALATLGIAQFRSGDPGSAIKSLQRAEQLGYRHPLVWLHLSLANSDLDHNDKAEQWFAKAKDWMDNANGTIPQLEKLLVEAKDELPKK